MKPEIKPGVDVIVVPVKDVARAKALYGKLLGAAPYADQPYYVGYKVGDLELGLDPNGHRQGTTCYWRVADIRASLKSLQESGAQIVQDVTDVGGGKKIAVVKDADGNVVGLTQSP